MKNRGCREPRRDSDARQTKAEPIDSLIGDLASDDWVVRVKAREGLVSRGSKAIAPLTKALGSPNQWVRWESAKAVCEIGNPEATDALIKALEDKMFDVRWLAAVGLITIGRKTIVPVLQAVIDNPKSVWIREGAHHVLHDLADGKLRPILEPVLKALQDVDATVEAPLAAKIALDKIKNMDLKPEAVTGSTN
jgi:HEAT repeat protein